MACDAVLGPPDPLPLLLADYLAPLLSVHHVGVEVLYVEGCSGGGVVEAVSYDVVLYLLLGDGVIAIAGLRVVYTRFRKSPVTDLQL